MNILSFSYGKRLLVVFAQQLNSKTVDQEVRLRFLEACNLGKVYIKFYSVIDIVVVNPGLLRIISGYSKLLIET